MSLLSVRTRTQLYCFASSPRRDLVGTVADAQHLGQTAVEQMTQTLGHGMIVEPPPQPLLCLERRRLCCAAQPVLERGARAADRGCWTTAVRLGAKQSRRPKR